MSPPIAAVSATCSGYLAYHFYNAPLGSPRWELYALAAASTIAIVPYTLIFMAKTNARLTEKAREAGALDAKEHVTEVGLAKGTSAKELLDWWGVLNACRALFTLAGAVLGSVATLG